MAKIRITKEDNKKVVEIVNWLLKNFFNFKYKYKFIAFVMQKKETNGNRIQLKLNYQSQFTISDIVNLKLFLKNIRIYNLEVINVFRDRYNFMDNDIFLELLQSKQTQDKLWDFIQILENIRMA